MKDIDWTAWFYTILLIVVFREGAVATTINVELTGQMLKRVARAHDGGF